MFKGNFGGGFGNMQNMIRQAQKMQEDLQRKQAELEEAEVIGASGGGMVEVVMSGKGVVKSVKFKPEAVDPDDVEMLEDLTLAAINDARAQVDALRKEKLGAMADGGML